MISDAKGGQNWILPNEINAPVHLRLSLARKLGKPVMSLYGTKWRDRGFGLRGLILFVSLHSARFFHESTFNGPFSTHIVNSQHFLDTFLSLKYF